MGTRPHALIIGAGFTGCATAHDLALRGFDVTVVERGDVASGTSGRSHGLLHSGGRYCVSDREAAVECLAENGILRRIAPQCIEPNGGLFVALDEHDVASAPAFLEGAQACGIPIEGLTAEQARRLEPSLSPQTLLAYWVPDGSFDPLRLALALAATAKANGARFRVYHEVERLQRDGRGDVVGALVMNRTNGVRHDLRADIVINATGAWVGEVAGTAGLEMAIRPTPCAMVAFDERLTDRPINRLNQFSDGDIVLPQRRMLVVGTTSFDTDLPDYVPVAAGQIELMIERGAALVPALRHARRRGAFLSTRPLVGAGASGSSVARTFKCFDHELSDGVRGLITVTGGKATICRAMAERVADMACAKLGLGAACVTHGTPLVSYRMYYVS